MEIFYALLDLCAGTSAHKCQWHGASMFALICAWINGWVNNREAGDLRRHHVPGDVIVMAFFGNWTVLNKFLITLVEYRRNFGLS